MTVFVLLASVVTTCAGQEVTTNQTKEITNSMGMKFVLIPAGRFTMGSPVSEEGSQDDEPHHKVEISKPYYIGVTEVTRSQYATVMGLPGDIVIERDPKTNRVVRKSEIRSSPVAATELTWEQAVEFCNRLSLIPEEKKAGRIYRLPTESEWEYACRAGTTTAFSFGNDGNQLVFYGWYTINSKTSSKVGFFKPNPWGLYDMHGNVSEWCSDWYGDYPEGFVVDPKGPPEGTRRVCRGGNFDDAPANCRSAKRFGSMYSSKNIGFRVAMSQNDIPQLAKPEIK
jgi:formylglycine-generating enzyme required for sulfatase activity